MTHLDFRQIIVQHSISKYIFKYVLYIKRKLPGSDTLYFPRIHRSVGVVISFVVSS